MALRLPRFFLIFVALAIFTGVPSFVAGRFGVVGAQLLGGRRGRARADREGEETERDGGVPPDARPV